MRQYSPHRFLAFSLSRLLASSSLRVLIVASRSLWLRWLLFLAGALSFAVFVRVTLYGRSALMEVGARDLLVPLVTLAVFVAWYVGAARLMGGYSPALDGPRDVLVAATFLPALGTLPITLGVLGSEAFAQEYWIDRSVKVELLLGVPSVVLLLQASIGIWLRLKLSWRHAGPVLAVLAVAFGLRYAGMGWGLPFAFQPEETTLYFRRAWDLALHGRWNPEYFVNPSLLIYLLGVEFLGIFAICRLLLFGSDPGELYMVFRAEQDLFYALGRLNSVVLGTATVLVVYLIARRLWGERAGLIAAALLAVNFLHVRNSQYAVNDVPSAFFVVLSLYFALRLVEDGRLRFYLLAGLMAGLAASAKYNGGMIVVSIVAAHWAYYGRVPRPPIPPGEGRGRGNSLSHGGRVGVRGKLPLPAGESRDSLSLWERVGVRAPAAYPSLLTSLTAAPLMKLGLAGAASVAGFVAGTPYSVLDLPAFLDGFMQQVGMGQTAWPGQAPEPTAWLYVAGIAHGAGLVPSALALLGGALLLIRDRGRAAILLSFLAAYLGFMSAMELFFVRWAVPAMPLVALLAAYGQEQLLRWAPRRRSRLVGSVLLILVLAQPAAYSLRLDWLLRQADTRQEANLWAERNLPAGSKVAIEDFSLLDQESLEFRPTLRQLDIVRVWRATSHDLAYYRENGFDYLAVSSFLYGRVFAQANRYPDRVEFYQKLDRELPLVAVFSPRADGGTPPFDLDDLDTPFWRLFSYDRPGPTVKVYRVRG